MKNLAAKLAFACVATSLAFGVTAASAQSMTFGMGSGANHGGSYWNGGNNGNYWHGNDYRWSRTHNWSSRSQYGSGVSFSIQLNTTRRTTSSRHVELCEDRYVSYDRRTDTFLGFDGDRHYCSL
jgi:hypothetical protein